jgi:tripartite-type tricarboxylate transporter receptor subunit TctC
LRLIGQKMSELSQPAVIDNRPGATIIGARRRAPARRRYTLFMAIDPTLVMNQYLYKSLPYDPLRLRAHIADDENHFSACGGLRSRLSKS